MTYARSSDYCRTVDLDGIVAFVSVVESGSFTRAARSLGLPKSSVSAKISGLESRLGARLLQRTTRHLSLTEVGVIYLKRCLQALHELDAGEVEVAAHSLAMKGVLRIASPYTLAQAMLITMVDTYLQRYPNVRVEISVIRSEDDLWAKGLDLALLHGKVKSSRLTVYPLGSQPIYGWATPEYVDRFSIPSHPKDLASDHLIRYGIKGVDSITFRNGVDEFSFPADGRLTVADGQLSKRFALLNRGISMLPAYACQEELKRGALVRCFPGWHWLPESQLAVVIPKQKFSARLVSSFMDVLKGCLPQFGYLLEKEPPL